ncbi:Ferredoxin-1 [Hibiscus syriacus]|uniref:Ferredoxin n=1 Tax=Hibiscus syriacus TaxID=106335 RepID=A0A6A2X5J6_HIBSY|nr:Ferredoxin-1 [Hibiscus syriacus]
MAASLLFPVPTPTKAPVSSPINSQLKLVTSGRRLVSAIEESKESVEDSVTAKEAEAETEVSEESELSAIGTEIKKAMKKREENGDSLAGGVTEEVREIEWPAFGKVLGTTGVVLGVISGSSVVLLTVNAVLAELSDQVFAATLHFTPSLSPPLILIKPKHPTKILKLNPRNHRGSLRKSSALIASSYKVVLEHEGKSTELEVEDDESILSKALEGLDVPHDCNLGVCVTCPAKLVSGTVDQSEGMLSDDVVDSGFALLCVSYPTSDCRIKTIDEEQLLALQLKTAND